MEVERLFRKKFKGSKNELDILEEPFLAILHRV